MQILEGTSKAVAMTINICLHTRLNSILSSNLVNLQKQEAQARSALEEQTDF